jgi:hypothetical protein
MKQDFGAHTNYCELALRELGLHDVFSHTGHATEINLRGRQVFPLVTGTFGAVDFLHSGEWLSSFSFLVLGILSGFLLLQAN